MTEQEITEYEGRLDKAREIKRKINSLESGLKQYQSEDSGYGYNGHTILVIKNKDILRSCFQDNELVASVKEHILSWFENKRIRLMEELNNV